MIRRPPRSTLSSSSAASDVYKRQEGIKLIVNDDNISDIHATITGPERTPYEGGVYQVKLVLGSEFPNSAPRAFFLTKIFHPNIATNGDVCVNTLKRDWKPGHTLKHVLTVIRCLLIEPFPDSALNEEAAMLMHEAYEDYEKQARLMTEIHAMPAGDSKQGDEAAPSENVSAADGGVPSKKADKAKKKKRKDPLMRL
eukprot:TRINITY_DN17240_c0_g1_i2.p1 TRINITY_DN17240_c0_g1~~TRINITY_DN17240_c0_g1_i2.p1  ORF type:complete len:197 (+),score=59.94 TRINITY_DN17240_c0_g1_i2:127-717(+)